jgi:hypothetical protein
MQTTRCSYVRKSTAKSAGNASLMQRVKVSHCGPPIVPRISTNDNCAKASGKSFTLAQKNQDILTATMGTKQLLQEAERHLTTHATAENSCRGAGF